MTENAPRIAILGRPGAAREHLRHALVELGGEIIAEGDMDQMQPDEVLAARPTVVVVSLDASMEDRLDAWDAVMDADGISVIFDEAETTSQLDGWDLARWARHLAAKILGHEQTLPPTPDGAESLPGPFDWIPSPGAAVTPAVQMDGERFEDYTGDSVELASRVPVADVPSGSHGTPDEATGSDEYAEFDVDGAVAEEESKDDPPATTEPPEAPSWELAGPDDGEPAVNEPSAPVESETDDTSGIEFLLGGQDESGVEEAEASLDDDDADAELALLDEALDSSESSTDSELSFDAMEAGDAPQSSAQGPAEGGYDFSDFGEDASRESGEMDDEIAALAAQMDSFQSSEDAAEGGEDGDPADDRLEAVQEPLESPEPDTDAPDAEQASVDAQADDQDKPDADFSFGRPLSLLGDDEEHADPVAEKPATATLSIDALAAAFQLESTDEEFAQQGAVVLLAGMGGPDALRQFLSALEPGFPVPVLVWQQLNAGTHERLASQLGKTGKVKTYVAALGAPVAAGEVGILPPGIGVSASGGLHFIEDSSGPAHLFHGLAPLGERAVVVALSGSESSWIEGVADWAQAGGVMLAQDPESCFEGATCRQLVEDGYRCAAPADLAVSALARWYEEY